MEATRVTTLISWCNFFSDKLYSNTTLPYHIPKNKHNNNSTIRWLNVLDIHKCTLMCVSEYEERVTYSWLGPNDA